MITPSNEFLELFKKTEGALSVCESIVIMNIAAEAPAGEYAEFGTYFGKSAMSALVSLKEGLFHLVDPIFENKEVARSVGLSVYRVTKGDITIDLINGYSTDIINRLGELSYVFVDSGSHQDGLPLQEVKLLEDRVVPGGIIAFHDYESQFKEVKEAYDYLVSTGKYEPIPIDWNSVINYCRENSLEIGNQSWHHTEMEFPNFVGAVKRKS